MLFLRDFIASTVVEHCLNILNKNYSLINWKGNDMCKRTKQQFRVYLTNEALSYASQETRKAGTTLSQAIECIIQDHRKEEADNATNITDPRTTKSAA